MTDLPDSNPDPAMDNETETETETEVTITRPILERGTPIRVEPKSPLESTAIWGLMMAVVAWAAKRWLPQAIQDNAIAAGAEIMLFLGGILMAAYGRWRATRPLGVSSAHQDTVVRLCPFVLALALTAPLATLTLTGCNAQGGPFWQTEAQQPQILDNAVQATLATDSYSSTAEYLLAAYKSGRLSLSDLRAVEPKRQAVNAAVTRMQTAAKSADLAAFNAAKADFDKVYPGYLRIRQDVESTTNLPQDPTTQALPAQLQPAPTPPTPSTPPPPPPPPADAPTVAPIEGSPPPTATPETLEPQID